MAERKLPRNKQQTLDERVVDLYKKGVPNHEIYRRLFPDEERPQILARMYITRVLRRLGVELRTPSERSRIAGNWGKPPKKLKRTTLFKRGRINLGRQGVTITVAREAGTGLIELGLIVDRTLSGRVVALTPRQAERLKNLLEKADSSA